MKGISIKSTIGVGDALQFSSVPENYFRATGQRLIDLSQPWFFDHNPYVVRNSTERPTAVTEMWNFGPKQYNWPKLRTEGVYLSNAEIHASVWGVPVVLNRPRLYQFEEYPYTEREKILIHIDGVSHGLMPAFLVQHIVDKYGPTGNLFQVGKTSVTIPGIPYIKTETLWDLAKVVSQAKIFIGLDSGPAWVAACYPDVVTKVIRMKPTPEHFKEWIPLAAGNIHSHWDDRCRHVFNPTNDDIGFTSSFRKL